MTDGTLEREAFADSTLGATDLTPAVTAVHAELWKWVDRAKQGATLVLIKADRVWLGKNTDFSQDPVSSGRPVFLFSLSSSCCFFLSGQPGN